MFEEKVTEIVALYLDPPDQAVVLCVMPEACFQHDETSQIQARDRTQPGLPLKKGRAAIMTHDDNRHGTTTLFAALDVRTGEVIGDCMPRHRANAFLKFPRNIDKAVLAHRDVHLVLDNDATHKTPDLQAWLAKHPRFKLAFKPTSASWLNLVKRFFAEIANRRIRRGRYSSVEDLEAAIYDYLARHNAKPKPFRWTKTAEDMLERGADVSHETIRRRRFRFGPLVAHNLRRCQPRPGDVWPLDEAALEDRGPVILALACGRPTWCRS